jgi:copper chaperone
MAHASLNVPDISCEHCQTTITKALRPIEGVHSVTVDIPSRQVDVDYDETAVDLERLKQILEQEDYPVASTGTS